MNSSGFTDLSVDAKIKGTKVRAKGATAGLVLLGLALCGILYYGDPQGEPGHLHLTLLLSFIAGIFLGAALYNRGMMDALSEKERYRQECERLANVKRDLEVLVVKKRLSSAEGQEDVKEAGQPATAPPKRKRSRSKRKRS